MLSSCCIPHFCSSFSAASEVTSVLTTTSAWVGGSLFWAVRVGGVFRFWRGAWAASFF